MISNYAAALEITLAKSPVIISYRFQLTIISPTTGYIEAFALFEDGSKLSIFEFLRYDSQKVNREKYWYQYMDDRDREIFRYDDAPHHKSVATFPHHKHIDKLVINSIAPSMGDVLKEVEHLILGLHEV